MWQTLAKLFKFVFSDALVKSVVSAILKAAGLAGSFWVWIGTFFAKKAVKKAQEELDSSARVEKRENADEKRKEHHDQLIKENASEEELVSAEESILNGGRRPKP